jgi:peptidoglycan LD-endopeptidase CwlK
MSRSLDDLSPLVRPQVDEFLHACAMAGLQILVTCTFRSSAEQAALYKQGRFTPGHIVTRAMPGQSAHNYGLAVDVVPIVNGKPDWREEDPVWQKLGQIGEASGLEWAGRWHDFPEFPHLQLPNWKMHTAHAVSDGP